MLRLYAGKDYLEQHGPINSRNDLEQHRFVSYVDDLVFSKGLLFLDEIAGSGAVGVRSTSVLAQQEAIAAGAGPGILLAFTADHAPRLNLIMPAQIRFIRTFWMLISKMAEQEQERGRLMGEKIGSSDKKTSNSIDCFCFSRYGFTQAERGWCFRTPWACGARLL